MRLYKVLSKVFPLFIVECLVYTSVNDTILCSFIPNYLKAQGQDFIKLFLYSGQIALLTLRLK